MTGTNADDLSPSPSSPPPVPQIIIYAGTGPDRAEIEAVLCDVAFSWAVHQAGDPAELTALLASRDATDLVVIAADGADRSALLFDVRSRAPFTPVIVLSRQIETELVVSCLLAGASDYLPWADMHQLPGRILYFTSGKNNPDVSQTSVDPRLKTLIEACPSPGWLTDRTGGFVYFNKHWMDFTGSISANEFGSKWRLRLFPEDRQRFANKFATALNRHQHFSIDFRMRRHDGAYRWVHAQGTPHRNIHGHFAGYIGSFVDINNQHESEIVLAYRAITQTALAGFGRFALIRQPFHKLIEEATRLVCDTLQLQHSEVLFIEAGELRRVASTGFDEAVTALPMSAPTIDQLDGQPLLLEYDREIFPGRENHPALGVRTGIAAAINGGRTLLGFLTGLGDCPQELGREATDFIQAVANILSTVYQREQAETALEESERKLLQSQKMEAVGLLAGGVAHDFNNLLTAMRCYGEMLHEDLAIVAPDLQPKTGEILKAAARASALTRQLLTFSRKQILQPETLDLNAVITDLKDLIRSLLSENVTLHVALMDGSTCCEADRNQIDQIILNLCLNARDAMANGGHLTVKIETRDIPLSNPYGLAPAQYLELQISDTGIGMSPEVQAQIFQPFFTTKALGHGTGLGLATCAVIAKNFHGAITFTSTLGEGTCFSVFIPRVISPVDAEQQPEEGPPGGGDEHILLVEDDDAVRHVATMILTKFGYKVTVFPGSREALEYFKANGPLVPMFDLLLSDMVMPFMNGRNLANEISAFQPGIKVLFMSGYVGDPDILAAVQDADLPFLAKPFTGSTLARKIREALG